ncbi:MULTISPECIES: hypothetical protein [Pseudomonas]|uniref:hypothetical protein n=1 Tax=Pseudomonas TaxID=286 RepID=UPI0021CEDE68|nr:hypothetical protein [Pseudomonas fluorescens]UXV21422.1 hypothetical protein N4P55_08730 [Pseudomonas fluorescens]
MTADFALGLWNDRWLMCDEEVRCSYCLASQLPSNADTPLIHCEGCELSHENFPLRDLRMILRGPSGPVNGSSVFSTNGVSLIRTRLANLLAALVCCDDIHALALHQERLEGFLEGVEAASVLTSDILKALYIAIEVAAAKRRQELKL